VLTPLELIDKIAALVPPPRAHRQRQRFACRGCRCNGNSNQRFKFDAATGRFSMCNYPIQVIDASRPDAGAGIIT
jgi:hypothetical protein